MFRSILKILFSILLLASLLFLYYFRYPFSKNSYDTPVSKSDVEAAEFKKLQSYGTNAKLFCKQHGYNTSVCILTDMSISSGRNRLFVYNMNKDSIISFGLVAHGSCNHSFLKQPRFSNQVGSGCSSVGRYTIGNKYKGRFGTSYKLHGLDTTNSNAYKRNIVLHSYYLVPDKEVDPLPICNSQGCVMVSDNYLLQLSKIIDTSSSAVMLWLFE